MTSSTRYSAPFVALLLACAGCSESDKEADEQPGDSNRALSGRCDPPNRIGGFEVGLDGTTTTVAGQVKDSVVSSIFLEDIGADDSCRLIRRTNPFCDPFCTSPTICSVDSECVAAPVAQSIGTVTVAGLASAVTMEPTQPGSRYFFTKLPHPGMVAGQAITLSAPGAELAALTLHGEGVDQVDLPAGEWTLERGKPIDLEWTPATNAAKTRVRATLNIDQHGSTPVTLHCDFADTGAGTIPAELVDGLLDAGISGFPNGNLYRETADKVDLDEGCVDLVVFAHVTRDLIAPDHIPCKSDPDCTADGQTCNVATETCE